MVEESMDSLKVMVMFVEIETVFAPLEGEVEEMVGVVVSVGVGVGSGVGETYWFSGVGSEPSEQPVCN